VAARDGSGWMTLGNRRLTPFLIVIAVGGEDMGSAICRESASTSAPSSTSFLVTSTVTISPLSASTRYAASARIGGGTCRVYQTSHSPASASFRPVLSTSR